MGSFLFSSANLKNGGRPPLTYQSFVATAGEPPKPVMEEYSELPPIGDTGGYELLPVPKLEELGYGDLSQVRAAAHCIQCTTFDQISVSIN